MLGIRVPWPVLLKKLLAYIASLDRILKQALPIFLPFCQHGGVFPLALYSLSAWWRFPPGTGSRMDIV